MENKISNKISNGELNYFNVISDELLLKICQNMDPDSLQNLMQSSSRVYQKCRFILMDRRIKGLPGVWSLYDEKWQRYRLIFGEVVELNERAGEGKEEIDKKDIKEWKKQGKIFTRKIKNHMGYVRITELVNNYKIVMEKARTFEQVPDILPGMKPVVKSVHTPSNVTVIKSKFISKSDKKSLSDLFDDLSEKGYIKLSKSEIESISIS